ncbi:hypothetical protein [Sphingomonas sp.]|uniref:hypothetical protein n=1 Tax=Sphingomonas sp. TaxID=28214 RepID=UPI0025EB7794|nr:hypothetical protein [Sphingomonas sp.]
MKIQAKRLGLAVSIALVGAVAPSLAVIATSSGTVAVKDPAEGMALSNKLAASIRADIAARPATASVEDLEGVIVFGLSHDDYSTLVMDNALTMLVTGPNVSDTLKQAVANVRMASVRRKLKLGTGAIPSRGSGFSGGGFGGGSSFSAPIVSVGGGSSNYKS